MMKKLFILAICLCFNYMLFAQVSKTINLATAGSLSDELTTEELATVTNLTLTGTIDARDFKTMRDEIPALKSLDLSGANIDGYYGTEGTSTGTSVYPNNAVPDFAFSDEMMYTSKISLITVKLPSAITSIGKYAFRGCSNLTSINIPSSISLIDIEAFRDCSELRSFIIPNGITTIKSGTFQYCTNLTTINIPTSVTSIEGNAFWGCTSLSSILIPASVTSISSFAFYKCSGLITVNADNPNFKSNDGVLFNKSQTKLIQCPFSKIGNYTIPSTVTSIEIAAFMECKFLTSIFIPSSVNFIDVDAFANCTSLTSINIPPSVTTIKASTFQYCSSLKSIIIPSTVIAIGSNAFMECTSLSSITVSSSVPINLNSSYTVFWNVNKTNCRLYVPIGSKSDYQAANQWKDFTNIIELKQTEAEAIIDGIITNNKTGLPIQGAIVKTLTYQSTSTDENGHYVLKVPNGYGYQLDVIAPSFETVTIPDISVPYPNSTKKVNIPLFSWAIEPKIVTMVPDPNSEISTVMRGGELHRYYKIINNISGNPLPAIPVAVTGNNFSRVFTSDDNGIVDITVQSSQIGGGQIGAEAIFTIASVNNVTLSAPIQFTTRVSPRIYSKYWDSQNYLKFGGNLIGLNVDDVKVQLGGITTLNTDESLGIIPVKMKISRQGRAGAEFGFKVKSPGLKGKLGPVKAGAMAEAGAGYSFTGIKEDEYTFPYISSTDYQNIAKYILFADGNKTLIDNTLIRLLTLCETIFSDNATLLNAYSSDAVGLEVAGGIKAEVFAGIDVMNNTKLGLMGDVGVGLNAGVKYKFNNEDNQVESSFSLAGKMNWKIGAGFKNSDMKFKDKLNIYDTNLQRGLRFTSVRDVNNVLKVKEYRLAFLSRNLSQDWEEIVEYRILGDQIINAVLNLVPEISQISNASQSGCDINVEPLTFQNITTKVFDLIDDIQATQHGEASISYTVSKTELTKKSAFDIGLDLSATVLAANIGGGTSFEEGRKMITEEGKWANGKHFINQQYTNPIPNIPVEQKAFLESIISEIPLSVRVSLGVVKYLFLSWLKSTNESFLIHENGSSIEISSGAIPNEVDSVAVTSWSWNGGAPNLKSASLTSRQRSIALQNRLDAEAIYGMQYGIGGFYQFEPYGMELLDTCLLTIKYDPAELGTLNKNSLGMYWEDKENKKWVYIGGVVDTVNNSVTAPITHLSLFTLAPAMPYGEFGMHATPDSIYADSISVTTVLCDTIFNNDHSVIKEGSLFTIGLSLGRVVDADADPITEGIQVPVHNGKLTFKVKSHNLAGIADVKASSVDGSANGATKITFFDTIPPSSPKINGAINELNSVLVKWKANPEEDIAGYIVYYDTDTIAPFDGIHTVYGEASPIILGNDTLLNVSELLRDTTYYFAVSAYDISGNESSLSNFVKGKINVVQQTITLNTGWNIFSLNVIPEKKDLKEILQSVIDVSKLKKVMDETGKVIENRGAYGGWVNSIVDMQNTEGYKVNVLSPVTLEVQGIPVALPMEIPLRAGWNIISWPSASEQDAMQVFEILKNSGKLKKVMDETGKVIENRGAYGGWVNSIVNMKPGEGYKVNVLATCTLTINESGPKSAEIQEETAQSTHFVPAYKGNGLDHMNIYLVDIDKTGLMEGDEIGVFDGNVCVGSGKVTSQNLLLNTQYSSLITITVSADDGIEEVDGFTQGKEIRMKLYRDGKEQNLAINPISSEKVLFERGGTLFARVDMATASQIVSQNFEVKCYPNPFSFEVTIDINLLKTEDVTVEIYDINSKLIKHIYSGNYKGKLLLKWDGKNSRGSKVSSGMYVIKINDFRGKILLNDKQ